MIINYNIDEINEVAARVIAFAKAKHIIFNAPMGAGKTTLIKALCKHMGVQDEVTSPTFSLVNEYPTNSGEIVYHFDLYRVNDAQELQEIGVEEYLTSDATCLIEWPELIIDLLDNYNSIKIKVIDNTTRELTIT